MIVGVIKVNTDLERMGDQAINISQNSLRLIGENKVEKVPPALMQMSVEVCAMVRDTLDGVFSSRHPDGSRCLVARRYC